MTTVATPTFASEVASRFGSLARSRETGIFLAFALEIGRAHV